MIRDHFKEKECQKDKTCLLQQKKAGGRKADSPEHHKVNARKEKTPPTRMTKGRETHEH